MGLFFWGYFVVLRNPIRPPATVPLTVVDEWVQFTPAAFVPYVSLWVYVSLPPAFLMSLPTLLRFAGWIGALCLGCLAVFWIFPTQVPAFPLDLDGHAGMELLRGVDASGNACPSLHVASAVFAAMWLDRLARAMRGPGWVRWANGLECGLILWSTLATRQHAFLDLAAGFLVGALFGWWSLRHAAEVARPGEL
ncbi:MAG: phosphatase PAP2 family protein [Zoogloeaceae bacterium]|nr:phosphatase PAP2 family protein [Zoogloeaceae bacterium]